MLRASVSVLLLAVVGAVTLGAVNAGSAGATSHPAPESPDPQRQTDLPQMLTLEWSAGRPMPQGMQDNHVTLIGNWLVSVGGFCQGGDDDWKPGTYPRGFLNETWGLDLGDSSAGWANLPDYQPVEKTARSISEVVPIANSSSGWSSLTRRVAMSQVFQRAAIPARHGKGPKGPVWE